MNWTKHFFIFMGLLPLFLLVLCILLFIFIFPLISFSFPFYIHFIFDINKIPWWTLFITFILSIPIAEFCWKTFPKKLYNWLEEGDDEEEERKPKKNKRRKLTKIRWIPKIIWRYSK